MPSKKINLLSILAHASNRPNVTIYRLTNNAAHGKSVPRHKEAGTKDQMTKMSKMTKKECFFVWRAKRGFPLAVVTPGPAESRMWLELSIQEADPFHACNAVAAFQAIATRVAS